MMDRDEKIMLAAVVLIVVAFIAFAAWMCSGPVEPFSGTIIDKRISEYTTTTYVMVGKVMIPMTSYHTDHIVITRHPDGSVHQYNVSSDFYYRSQIGETYEKPKPYERPKPPIPPVEASR